MILEKYYLIFLIKKCNNFEKQRNLVDRVNFAYKYFNKPITLWQVREEVVFLMEILQKEKPRYILEIGTAGGGSLYLLSQVIADDAIIISVDLPYGRFGGGYPKSRISIYRSIARAKQKIYLIRNDSHSLKTLEKIQEILSGNELDFIFIDGDHEYEGVKKDFELYSRLVKDHGIIAFHDIVEGPQEAVGGVPKFWSEIKVNFKNKEIVKDWAQRGYGIGLLYIKKY
jgi:predicted O-methyltransferase YrrM